MRRKLLCLCVVAAALLSAWPILAGRPATRPQSPATRDVHFYFVQIADTHLDGGARHAERTQKVVEAVNDLPMKIECVVHTGDVFMDVIRDDAIRAKALETLGKLKAPVHYLPGNHDILGREELVRGTAEAYTKSFGPLCGKAQYKGVVFLTVYTEPLAKDFEIKGYDALAWLAKALQDARGKPVIVFHHTPCVEDFFRNRFHEGWPDETRDKWVKLLNAHNVKAVIAAHFHRDEHHWLGNVPLYVSGSVAGYFGRQATFRVYEYHNGRVGYRTVYLPD